MSFWRFADGMLFDLPSSATRGITPRRTAGAPLARISEDPESNSSPALKRERSTHPRGASPGGGGGGGGTRSGNLTRRSVASQPSHLRNVASGGSSHRVQRRTLSQGRRNRTL